ncbi:MAG: sulfotransferase [Thermomicrobiales bacterium]
MTTVPDSLPTAPTTPRVFVAHVQTGGARRDALRGEITAPASGSAHAGWGLRVSGVLHPAAGEVARIEAVTPGQILASAATGPKGTEGQPFTLLVNTLDLPLDFEFRLRGVLADGGRVKFATVRGRREPLRGREPVTLQPLIVTSLGRMGTTLLMKLLAAHPGVVTYDRPPFEARGAKYWVHLLGVLSAPTDPVKQIGAPMEFHANPIAVGGNPFYSSEFQAWPAVEDWMGGEYITDLATFCQQSIDGWYLATAEAQDKPTAPLRYFAEKHFPDAYPRRLRELYPAAQELFLVRDFRDMVASMHAYNARKGYGDFGRAAAADDGAWLQTLRQGVQRLHAAWQERGTPAHLVRYEDLVQRPETALPPLLALLGLANDPQTVAALLAAAAPDAPDLQGHGTAASPAASIGRWREDLPPEAQAQVAAEFGELLRAFGYEEA